MLDKCRNITLAENSRQTSTLSLIDVSSQKLGTHAAERQGCRLIHTDQLPHPQKYLKCLTYITESTLVPSDAEKSVTTTR